MSLTKRHELNGVWFDWTSLFSFQRSRKHRATYSCDF